MSVQDSWCNVDETAAFQQPQPPDPRLREPLTRSICHQGWQPILLTGVLRDMLTRHFATPLNIEHDDLRPLVWREDERTRILIESLYRRRADLVGKLPAVFIKQNARQNLRLAIGEVAGVDSRGMIEYATFWVGSHTLFVLHGSGAGAEILATEVQREIHQWHPVITDYLGLLRFAVTEVGEIAEVEEARETFVVPVTVGWAYQELWRIDVETPKHYRLPLSAVVNDVYSFKIRS